MGALYVLCGVHLSYDGVDTYTQRINKNTEVKLGYVQVRYMYTCGFLFGDIYT